jgi:hypothetical protein
MRRALTESAEAGQQLPLPNNMHQHWSKIWRFFPVARWWTQEQFERRAVTAQV